MKIFEKAIMRELNISKQNLEKVASEKRRSNVDEFKELINENIVSTKLAQITGGNPEMEEVIDIVLRREKTASAGKKKYSLDMQKFAGAILQRLDVANEANKRMVYSDGSAKLIKMAYSSMWDEEVVNMVSPVKLATQLLINDISFFRGRDDLKYDFLVETPEVEKVAEDLKKSILNERVLERIENEIDEEVADDLRSDYDTMYNALPDPYKDQINGIVEDEMGKVAFADNLRNKFLAQTSKGVENYLSSGREPKIPGNSDVKKNLTPRGENVPKLNGFSKKAEEVKKMKKEDTSPYIREEAKSLPQGEFPNKGVEFSYSNKDIKKMFPEQGGNPWRSVEFDKTRSSLYKKDEDGEMVPKETKTVYDMLNESERFSKKKKIASFLSNYSTKHMDHTDKDFRTRGILAAGIAQGAKQLDSIGDSGMMSNAMDGFTGLGLGLAGAVQGYNTVNSRNKFLKSLGAAAGGLGGAAVGLSGSQLIEDYI